MTREADVVRVADLAFDAGLLRALDADGVASLPLLAVGGVDVTNVGVEGLGRRRAEERLLLFWRGGGRTDDEGKVGRAELLGTGLQLDGVAKPSKVIARVPVRGLASVGPRPSSGGRGLRDGSLGEDDQSITLLEVADVLCGVVADLESLVTAVVGDLGVHAQAGLRRRQRRRRAGREGRRSRSETRQDERSWTGSGGRRRWSGTGSDTMTEGWRCIPG